MVQKNPPKRGSTQKRNSILDAAMDVFSSEGYDRASVDRIAAVAATSKRTVYDHFTSKENLFQAVVTRFADQLQSLNEIHYDPNLALDAQLEKFIDAELALIENPLWFGFVKTLLSVIVRDSDYYRTSLAKFNSEKTSLVAWIKNANADGKLCVDQPEIAAKLLSSMISGAFTWPAVYSGLHEGTIDREMKRVIIGTFLGRYSAS